MNQSDGDDAANPDWTPPGRMPAWSSVHHGLGGPLDALRALDVCAQVAFPPPVGERGGVLDRARSARLVLRAGDTVTVRAAEVDHHHRTPWFVKGKSGTVRLVHGAFPNPETRAHGGDGLPKRRLCQVEFRQADVWGPRYRGSDADMLVLDVFEQWLERT